MAEIDPDALRVLIYPAPVLRRTAEPVTEIDERLVAICRRMLAMLPEHRGVGLAAPQVGLSRRFFVMNPSGEPGGERVVINPRILARAGRAIMVEGCLSLPEIEGKIERASWIRMSYYDLEGREQLVELRDFEARVAQHEIDHLDGILIVDRMRPAERAVAARQLRELQERAARRAARAGQRAEDPAPSQA
ncbi:MAG: peptide deformylase [Planctomycetota bacterium]|nr:MAG: peptide deformylase [Planctomycetota bacterium]